MKANQLTKIIWPTSVDIMGQIVVAMAFFFLLIFIILAYFLKQIELKQRVQINEQVYQNLYQPLRKYLGSTDSQRKEKIKPNIDELILQIQDYILSVPDVRVSEIQSLIAKRDKLASELYNLGYTSYQKTSPFTGDYSVMSLVTTELLESQGNWIALLTGNQFFVRFNDNSLAPQQSYLSTLRVGLSKFLSTLQTRTIKLTVFDSNQIITKDLSQQLSLHRLIAIRNLIQSNNIPKENIRIENQGMNSEYLYGAIKVSYE